jgi:hypothetical protein
MAKIIDISEARKAHNNVKFQISYPEIRIIFNLSEYNENDVKFLEHYSDFINTSYEEPRFMINIDYDSDWTESLMRESISLGIESLQIVLCLSEALERKANWAEFFLVNGIEAATTKE